jgi:PAS domain S-box-containing protein
MSLNNSDEDRQDENNLSGRSFSDTIGILTGAEKTIITTAMLLAVIPLIFWLSDIETLKKLRSFSGITPLETACFLLTAISLYLSDRPGKKSDLSLSDKITALMVLSIALFRIYSLFQTNESDLNIFLQNHDFFSEDKESATYMSPGSALCFLLTGTTLFFKDLGISRNFSVPGIFPAAVIIISISGIYYSAEKLTEQNSEPIGFFMPFLSAVIFILLAIGTIMTSTGKLLIKNLVKDSCLPTIFLIITIALLPALLEWLRFFITTYFNLPDAAAGVLCSTISFMVLLFLIINRSSLRLQIKKNKLDSYNNTKAITSKFETILDKIPAEIYICNQEGIFETVNESFAGYTGKEKSEITGRKISDIFNELTSSSIRTEDARIISQNLVITREEKQITRNKSYFFETIKFSFKNPGDNRRLVCTVRTDISRMKEAESRTREQEKLVETIIKNVTEGIIISFPDNSSTLNNQSAEEIMGISVLQQDYNEWKKKYRLFLSDGITPLSENSLAVLRKITHSLPEDTEFVICDSESANCRRIKIINLHVFHPESTSTTITILRDVTKRVNLQDRLRKKIQEVRENSYFIKKVSEAIPDIFYIYDIVSNRNIFTNKSIGEYLGYTQSQIFEMGDQLFSKLMHPDDLMTFIHNNILMMRAEDEEIRIIEFRIKDSSGKWRWFLAKNKVFKRNTQGNVIQIIAVAIDNTSRKLTELELQESRFFIKNIMETTPNNIFVYDLENEKNIFINKSLKEDLGYLELSASEDSSDENFLNFVHPEDQQLISESFRQIRNSPDSYVHTIEFRMVDARKNWRWLYSKIKSFKRNEQNEVIQILGELMDITSRKWTEDELIKSQKFIQKITGTMPDLVFVYAPEEQKYIYTNRDLFTVSISERSTEIPYANFRNKIHPDDRNIADQTFSGENLRKEGGNLYSEFRITDNKNNYHWISARTTIFETTTGQKIVKILGILSDITIQKDTQEKLEMLNRDLETKVAERTSSLKKNQETLQQRENQLQIIANTIPAYIAYIDNTEKYLFANTLYRSLIKPDFVGKKTEEVAEAEFSPFSIEDLDRAMKGEVLESENILYRKKEDDPVHLKVHLIPDKDPGNVVNGVVVMAVDITGSVRYEKLLKEKNEELLRINSDLDTFIYTASHDFKTPIANTEGLLNLLEEELKPDKKPETVHIFSMLRISLERLKMIGIDMEQIGMIKISDTQNAESIDLNKLFQEIIAQFRELIMRSRAVIEVQTEANEMSFSKQNLHTIIFTILDNAFKYRDPARILHISLSSRYDGEYIVITIKDNGIGIEPLKINRIFGLYKRMHTHVEGKGIGLYIARRIAENSGGKIEAESKPGVGSTFMVWLKSQARTHS